VTTPTPYVSAAVAGAQDPWLSNTNVVRDRDTPAADHRPTDEEQGREEGTTQNAQPNYPRATTTRPTPGRVNSNTPLLVVQ